MSRFYTNRPQPEKPCTHCGNLIPHGPSHSRARFCSFDCYNAARRSGLTVETLPTFYDVDPVTGCWNWNRAKYTNGRGHIQRHGKRPLAYRAVYELLRGPIPDDMQACHRCDNPTCVNPDHIFIGTDADNQRDCREKGRNSRGEKHPISVLTEASVREIRQLHAAGVAGYRVLGQRFGVTRENIRAIIRRVSWNHVS